MKYVNKIKFFLQCVILLILLSSTQGYPQKPEDNNATKADDKPTSPIPTMTHTKNDTALPISTTVALTTIAETHTTTMSAIPAESATTSATTVAIKALENEETSNAQRQKRQATIPAFPTNALPGNGPPSNLGAPPSGSIPLPSGSSLPQPNIATAGAMNNSISPSLAASPKSISAAAASLQPVKFPPAGK
ncbi:unnamed protein product [Chironomus riparius]|uniref:Uncharacterized protein n=1 Tax=Chironomus riparius TaxID=315576 RepID=A0A9N9WZG8_9DIPT|nr:unnamed protein product [Chironomus riparius]